MDGKKSVNVFNNLLYCLTTVLDIGCLDGFAGDNVEVLDAFVAEEGLIWSLMGGL